MRGNITSKKYCGQSNKNATGRIKKHNIVEQPMSALAIIIYECLYLFFYFGLLLSKSTFYKYFPNPSLIAKAIFLFLVFSGFFLPYLFKRLRITLTGIHYVIGLCICAVLYCCASGFYYSKTLRYNNFHAYTKAMPKEHDVAIPKPPDVFRIICLGGSTTYAGGYPGMLRTMLAKHYPQRKIEVLNAGMFGYSTQDAIIQYLFHLKELKPDVIIFFEALNDIIPSFTMPPLASAPFRRDYGHYYGLIANVRYPKTFEKFLLEFLYADLWKPKLKPMYFTDFKSLDSFRRNLETLIAITRCENIQLVLSNQAHVFADTDTLLYPSLQLNSLIDREHYANNQSWYYAMELFNKTAEETAARHAVPFVDQQAVFQSRPELFEAQDTVHMTPEGIELKARLFYDKIVSLRLLE